MATLDTPTKKAVLSEKIDKTKNPELVVKEFCTFSAEIYNAMLRCKRSMGLSKTQDVTRLALQHFLKSTGHIK